MSQPEEPEVPEYESIRDTMAASELYHMDQREVWDRLPIHESRKEILMKKFYLASLKSQKDETEKSENEQQVSAIIEESSASDELEEQSSPGEGAEISER